MKSNCCRENVFEQPASRLETEEANDYHSPTIIGRDCRLPLVFSVEHKDRLITKLWRYFPSIDRGVTVCLSM